MTLSAPRLTDELTLKELLELPETRNIAIKFVCLCQKVLSTEIENADPDREDLDYEVYRLYRSIPMEERRRAWEHRTHES